MENLRLTDKTVQPDKEQVYAIIGENRIFWDKYLDSLNKLGDVVAEWKSYRDSKCWLMKVNRKKNTLCWIILVDDTFKINFWFGIKAEPKIEESDLPVSIKENYRNAEQNKLGRGLSIVINSEQDLLNAVKLAEFKSKL